MKFFSDSAAHPTGVGEVSQCLCDSCQLGLNHDTFTRFVDPSLFSFLLLVFAALEQTTALKTKVFIPHIHYFVLMRRNPCLPVIIN